MSTVVTSETPTVEPGTGTATAPAAPRTIMPVRPGAHAVPAQRRAIGGVSRDAVLVLFGAMASAVATTALVFGRLTPLSGKFGFVVVLFLVFLVTYTVLISLTERTTAIVDRVMTVLLTACAAAALFALFSVVIFVLAKGFSALRHANFYTEDMSVAGPLDPLTTGGILHAIAGTLIMTLIALIITVPLALATAVYMTESGSRWAGFVRTVVTAMTALPSILAGLFIFATWILILGFERSGLAAAIAMSIMILPIIVRSADVVLRLVPGNLREAAAALGAPQWRTVWHVVLPTARSGLTTSVILGVARGIGETAPVLLTAGFTSTMNVNPRANPMVSLPLAAYELVRSPQENLVARGFGAAAVLMLLVLVLFTLARILGGRPAGRLSKRGARRTAARSAEDVRRFEARAQRVDSTDHTEVVS